jgi:hypothetical protein
VAAAVAELYGADPDAFTERRKALVAAAKEAGDREAAAAIGALRKPTRAAWLVNRLARAEPSAADRMAALAAELRAAEAAKDGRRLRELSAARGALIDSLTDQALAGVPDPTAGLRAEVTETLTSALADPATAADFAAGTLTKAAQWSGFGYAEFGSADDASADASLSPTAADPAPVDIATRRARRARDAADSGADARTAPVAEPGGRSARGRAVAVSRPGRAPARADADAARRAAQERDREQDRLAAEDQRRAQEAAERAARAREKFEDAERTLAQASAVAVEAGAVEDRLEAEVRQLEERLTQAREELVTARLRARRAEAAERRARQAVDRLQ